MSEENGSDLPAPLYQPDENGRIVVYAGDLLVSVADQDAATVAGQLELRLSPKPSFVAHFAGPFSEVGQASWLAAGDGERTVAIPEDASLAPPIKGGFAAGLAGGRSAAVLGPGTAGLWRVESGASRFGSRLADRLARHEGQAIVRPGAKR